MTLEPRWKRILLTATPLRSPRIRLRALKIVNRARRFRRRQLERRGDSRLSQPAQHGMDLRLAELLGEGGFFVEAGANDGYQQSNTYYLERFCGWRGILIEPIPELYGEAVAERPDAQVINAALVSPSEAGGMVRMRFGGLMSNVADSRGAAGADHDYIARGFILEPEQALYEVEAPARTLSQILDSCGVQEVDLLSLDVEGFEPQVLEGLDFDRHAPGYLLVEVWDGEQGVARFGSEFHRRYRLIEKFSEIDMLFRRSNIDPARTKPRQSSSN
jgi:FkbM family methyltransferase